MGFSTHLQSKAAHEALLSRQDAELRLLETMRRCISSKIKSDKDYSLALASIASQGQKVDRCEDMLGSLVAQAWRGMMEELDNAAKLVKSNAETVEKETLEKLNILCQEKRKARKQYLEEHNRITQHFAIVSFYFLIHTLLQNSPLWEVSWHGRFF
jgi:tyrosine-protein kinase Fer